MSGFPGDSQSYLYAIQRGGEIKIGSSHNPRKRAHQLRGVLLRVAFGDHREERELHEKLAPYRVQREWFQDCGEVWAAISSWHSPDWLDRCGGWMPFGRFVGIGALEDEPWVLRDEDMFPVTWAKYGRRRRNEIICALDGRDA